MVLSHTLDWIRCEEIMRHSLHTIFWDYSRNCGWNILQDHASWNVWITSLDFLDLMAYAATNIDHEDGVWIFDVKFG